MRNGMKKFFIFVKVISEISLPPVYITVPIGSFRMYVRNF